LQAQQTRRDIVDAARRLFAERGYSVTSVKDIAAEAGVSVQTVYDSVGRKPELLVALNDAIDESARVGEIVGQALAEGTTDPLDPRPDRVMDDLDRPDAAHQNRQPLTGLPGGASAFAPSARDVEQGWRRAADSNSRRRRLIEARVERPQRVHPLIDEGSDVHG